MPNGDGDHIRGLLDQRSQRADVPQTPHTRFSTLSDRSDVPSMYSHFSNNYPTAARSPISPHFPHHDDRLFVHDDTASSIPLSPAERLADPNASCLDLTEDNYSENGSQDLDLDADESPVEQMDDDGSSEHRMSLLGPKVRVHSRAPWESGGEEETSGSEREDSGIDGLSIFGGKKTGRSVMKGLGFAQKSPGSRQSSDSNPTSKGKRSFETTSSGPSAIHALAQASMSTTSLALAPSSSAGRLPHKGSYSRLALNRDPADAGSVPPPFPSPHSAVFSERSGRSSPYPHLLRRASPARSEASQKSRSRTRSPSPLPIEKSATYIHPYANPDNLPVYSRDSSGTPSLQTSSRSASVERPPPHSESLATLATSEETVTLSHSNSYNSSSGMQPSASSLSTFSASPASHQQVLNNANAEKARQRRLKRETKIGPISAPSLLSSSSEYPLSTPYNLISLEQAQARMKNAQVTGESSRVVFPGNGEYNPISGNTANSRSRTTSAKQFSANAPDSPASMFGHNPVDPLGGKALKQKRSGFMRLFNGKEKDKIAISDVPPLPSLDSHGHPQSPVFSHPPPVPRIGKSSQYRVPIPSVDSSITTSTDASFERQESRPSGPRRAIPPLAIKVNSPPESQMQGVYYVSDLPSPKARKSDSPKMFSSSLKPDSPTMPKSAPPGKSNFTALSIRPVSSFFVGGLEHLLPGANTSSDGSNLTSPTTVNSDDSPMSAAFGYPGSHKVSGSSDAEKEEQAAIIANLKEQIRSSRKIWQRQIWELEGQIRDLKTELDEMKSGDICESCGRGILKHQKDEGPGGVIHRPRAKTGTGARFASGNEV